MCSPFFVRCGFNPDKGLVFQWFGHWHSRFHGRDSFTETTKQLVKCFFETFSFLVWEWPGPKRCQTLGSIWPKYLKLWTFSRFWPQILMSELIPLVLLVISLVFSALISMAYVVDAFSSWLSNLNSPSSFRARASLPSAKRKFVIALPPMLTDPSWSSKASVMILSRKMLKRVGESRHTCLTPAVVLNHSPTFMTDEGSKQETLSRIDQTVGALSKLKTISKDKNIALSSKIRMRRSLVISIFLYACEIWTITAELERKIQATDMRCFQRLLGICYRDHVTNEELRNINTISHVIGQYEDLIATARKLKLRWYGHITRSTGLAKMILQCTVHAGRRRGNQKKR